MDVVILGVGLDRTRRRKPKTVVAGAKAPHVQPPHVPLRVTIDDPLCHDLADAARACQSVSTERACYPETLDRRGTKQILAVGRETFGTVEQFLDFRLFHDRDALDGVL